MVIDKTGLTGRYDLMLPWVDWSPIPTGAGAESDASTQANSEHESIFTVMKEQLGLELKAAKEPITVFILDNIEEPTPN